MTQQPPDKQWSVRAAWRQNLTLIAACAALALIGVPLALAGIITWLNALGVDLALSIAIVVVLARKPPSDDGPIKRS
jgi:hypothetical protein